MSRCAPGVYTGECNNLVVVLVSHHWTESLTLVVVLQDAQQVAAEFCRPTTEDTREEECVTSFVVLRHSLCERIFLGLYSHS